MVLSKLLRIGDFNQYAGKTILNNVYYIWICVEKVRIQLNMHSNREK